MYNGEYNAIYPSYEWEELEYAIFERFKITKLATIENNPKFSEMEWLNTDNSYCNKRCIRWGWTSHRNRPVSSGLCLVVGTRELFGRGNCSSHRSSSTQRLPEATSCSLFGSDKLEETQLESCLSGTLPECSWLCPENRSSTERQLHSQTRRNSERFPNPIFLRNTGSHLWRRSEKSERRRGNSTLIVACLEYETL